MNNWQEKPISALGKIVTGKTPSKAEPDYWGGNELFVSPKDMERDSFYIKNTQANITKKALSKFKSQRLPKNSVMYTSLSYGFGKIGITLKDVLTNQQITSVVANKDNDYRFIYYLLRISTPHIFAYNSGIDTPIVPKSVFEKIKLPVPILPIQKIIAAILSAYDELIENNNRRIAIMEKMAEEIYREWFVRMRFPGHEKVKVVKGVPEGWELKRFRYLISYYIGGGWGNDYQNIEFYKPAYVIRGTDIPKLNNGIFKHEILRYHKTSNFKTRQLIKDDIVFEVSGGSKDQLLGRTLLITKDLLEFFNNNVICASFCKLIRPNQENVRPLFLKHFFKLYYDTGMVGTFQTQSTGISNYHFEDFLNFQTLNVPDITTQRRFENTVQPIIEEKNILSLENSTLKQSRDLLLPRLISGKLDVEKLDIAFPPGMQSPAPKEGKEAEAA